MSCDLAVHCPTCLLGHTTVIREIFRVNNTSCEKYFALKKFRRHTRLRKFNMNFSDYNDYSNESTKDAPTQCTTRGRGTGIVQSSLAPPD